jgi:hypothetical protein
VEQNPEEAGLFFRFEEAVWDTYADHFVVAMFGARWKMRETDIQTDEPASSLRAWLASPSGF